MDRHQAETGTRMIGNFRLRKPLMLLLMIGFFVYANFKILGWFFTSGNEEKDVTREVSSEIKDNFKVEEHDFHQNIGPSSANVIRSKTFAKPADEKTMRELLVPQLPQKRKANHRTEEVSFYDQETLQEALEEDRQQEEKIDLNFEGEKQYEYVTSSNDPKDVSRRNSRHVDVDEGTKEGRVKNIFGWSNPYSGKPEYSGKGLNRFGNEAVDLDGDDSFEINKPVFNHEVQGKQNVTDPVESFDGPTYEPGRQLIQEMMKHAWKGYKDFAWGEDELKPWSKEGENMLGDKSLGCTPVDALDTLWLMGMRAEFDEAAEYVLAEVDFNQTNVVSLFETNIRVLGGLLSAYALSKDDRFLAKAKEIGDKFMVNFSEDSVFPNNNLQLNSELEQNNKKVKYGFSGFPYSPSHRTLSLAQVGTFSLEFGYLSHVTGNPVYKQKAEAIVEELSKFETTIPGLYPQNIAPSSKTQPFQLYSLAGDADSFYEYLLKYWLLTGKKDRLHHDMYLKAVEAIQKNLITEIDGKKYIVSRFDDEPILQLEHLACFAPGMLGLGASHEGDKELLKLAEDLTETCYLSYHQQGKNHFFTALSF